MINPRNVSVAATHNGPFHADDALAAAILRRNASVAATHNGPFHADDVLSAAILRLAGFTGKVVRTRDAEVLASCPIIFDVGNVHDASFGRFDHHQKGGAGTRPNGVPYSSAGLVWAVYGPLCAPSEVCALVDKNLIQPVDALDTGYGTVVLAGDVNHFTFSDMISGLNPTWQEEPSPEDFDAAFATATYRAMEVLKRAIVSASAEVNARRLVDGSTDKVVVLDRFAPVMDYLVGVNPKALYLVFPSPGGEWMVQCVPPVAGSFDQRKPLPEAWAGLRFDALAEVTGVSDSVFCHAGRFICGAKSREGAIKLATLACGG